MHAKSEIPRSEQVRQRRAQRSQDRVSHASKRAIYNSELPAVVVRGGFGTPVIKHSRNRPRHSLSIPLVITGGKKVRTPSLPIIRPGWRLFSVFLSINLIFLIYLMLTSPALNISILQLNGVQRLTAEDFEKVLHLSGMNICTIDPQSIYASLKESFPELSYINVQIGLPNKVIITGIERQPVLAWEHGKVKWIDAEGYIFPARGEPASKLIYVTGDTTPPLISETSQETPIDIEEKSTTNAEKELTPQKESKQNQRMDPMLVQAILKLNTLMPDIPLFYSGKDGLGWKDPAGWQVFIGTSPEQFDEKMIIYQSIVKKLNEQGTQPAMISIEYMHAPFYRMES